MPKEKAAKTPKMLSVDNLRHAEYYEMQEVFDDLYARSQAGEKFTDLMGPILSRENILLAYRNIKTNSGSNTVGTDRLTIKDIGRLTPDEVVEKVRFIVQGTKHGYRPKPVRRKEIPKPNGSTRPLGIPCIWDRLIQQCIKQVMEPICEAKFSDNSHGFRPQRSAEHAIAAACRLMQRSNLHYVVEFDIKGFFDNVDHSKLIKQIWAMGIRDKHLLWVLKQILKAPIKMPNGSVMHPSKGTPQGGIISPLLANIVLNELDHWIESQWQQNPVIKNYKAQMNQSGTENQGDAYAAMRKTRLKEMYIVRYADDFRIFCRTKADAEKTKIAVTQWLSERLKLEVSPEKTRVVNVKRRYSGFLGFKIKVHQKGQKQVVKSHICDKQMKRLRQKLTEQAKAIARPSKGRTEADEIHLYNSMVMGIQSYYHLATDVNIDFSSLNRAVMTILTNRLRTQKGSCLAKEFTSTKRKGKPSETERSGRPLTKEEVKRFSRNGAVTSMMRWVRGSGEPVYPIGYVRCKNPMAKRRSICCYTAEGRQGLHDNLQVNVGLMSKLMRQPLYGRSAEYADNRISLFSAQWGKCAVTGQEFLVTGDIHCHHIRRRADGGGDEYGNLVLLLEPVHRLIHATNEETIGLYLKLLNLDKGQLQKLNELRRKAGLNKIAITDSKTTNPKTLIGRLDRQKS